MIIILGLLILVAAVVVAVAGVLANGGSAHPLGHGFSVLGYHVTGSAGMLFLLGIAVGAAGLLGLVVLMAGARRSSRRASAARRGLRDARRETAAVSQDRDQLVKRLDTARTDGASPPDNGMTRGDRDRSQLAPEVLDGSPAPVK